jgi:hypothetical protein
MKIRSTISTIAILALHLACQSTTGPAKLPEYVLPESSVLVPMDSGNSWIYDSYDFWDNGNIVQYAETSFVNGDTIIDGQVWSKADIKHTYLNYIATNRRDGAYKWLGRAVKYYSLIRGDIAYHPVTDVEGVPGWYIQLVSTDTTITVPAGTFKTLVFHEVTDGIGIISARYYFAPNVGLVRKIGYYWTTGQMRFQCDLASYSLN